MAAILGLLDAERFRSQRFTNIRRSVFYYFPNGAAPLLGLLSLMDSEVTNDAEFSWFEKIKDDQRTLTVANTTGVFITNTATNADAASPFSPAAGSTLRLLVADATKFRIGHVVRLGQVPLNAGGTTVLQGRVVAVAAGAGGGGFTGVAGTKQGIDIILQEAPGSILNAGTTVGLEVLIVGNVAAEGQVGAAPAPYNVPVQPGNYCQIQRTSFTFTGTAGKTSATFDREGPYLDKSMEASRMHMCEMERSFLFGKRQRTTDAQGNPLRFMGGILWFLEQWEATSNNLYGRAGATADTDDDKRIITNSGGTINEKTFDKYMERLFRFVNNKTNEKLCLCGSGFLMVINQMFRNKAVLNVNMGDEKKTYGLDIVSMLTCFGTIHFKSHPLYNENPFLRNAATFLDVHTMKIRHMAGRDTQVLKNRQPNNADYREDELFTDNSLEMKCPASALHIWNVTDYTT